MAAYATRGWAIKKIIWNGDAGERWTNDTGKVQYQFVAELRNTCGACLQMHMAIASWWPIPIHRNCRCRQERIAPGAQSRPFVDFRAVLDGMSEPQKRAAVGKSVYRLIQRGVVKWGEAVAPSRVRTLREIVARGKLSIGEMTKAGVREPIAQHAWRAVNTPVLKIVDAHRKALVAGLERAGAPRDKIIEAAAEKLADRITIGRLDLGGDPLGGDVVPGPPKIGPDDLIRILGLDKAKTKAALKKTPKPKPEAKPEAKPKTWAKPRPETDAPEFPRSTAEVVFAGPKPEQKAARRWLAEAFGERSEEVIASIAGAPDDAMVKVESLPYGAGIRYTISHPNIKECQGEMRWLGRNEVVHHPVIFEVTKDGRGAGFGSRVHGRRVYWGQKMGVTRLTIEAGRGHDMNGYAVWPVVGYDGKLPFEPHDLPESLRAASTVQELLSLPGGPEWWLENGVTTTMRFDLEPGSRNAHLWNRFWTKKPREATGD